MRALEVNENSDRRQFEFHRERIASAERGRDKSHSLARIVVIYGGLALIALVAFVLYLAFYGTEQQTQVAITMIIEGAQALGGAGFFFLIWTAIRSLIHKG